MANPRIFNDRSAAGVTRDVVFLIVGFALLRAWTSAGLAPMHLADTVTYMHLDLLGHGGDRLWTVPLLYTVLPDDRARILAQLLIGIVCWSCLSFAVARSLVHPVVARVGAVVMLLLGLCAQVTQWDRILMSESLALSLTALLVACLLWLRLRPTPPRIALAIVVAILWAFTRQLQAVLFVLAAIALIVWIVLRRRRLIAVGVVLAFCALWAGYATSISGKLIIRENAHDLLVLRILQSPENAKYFESRGMPQMPALRKEAATRSDAYIDDPVYKDPEWQRWIDAHWQRTYAAWLLRRPIADIRAPLADALNELSGLTSFAYVRPALPAPIQLALWDWSKQARDLPVLVGAALVLVLASLRARRLGNLEAVAGGLLVVTLVWYFLAWHLGAVSFSRIMIPVAASLRISLLLLGLAAADRLLEARLPSRLADLAERPGPSS